MTGFFGKIPAAGDFVSWNLPRSFIDPWDRWFSAELLARPDEGPLDPRAWRFVVPAGVFGDQPVAGVWRMSEDRAGRRYPFVIARLGETPDPGDAWFDEVARLLARLPEHHHQYSLMANHIGRVAPPRSTRQDGGIAFWIEDWEVQEMHFEDARALADRGLTAMRRSSRLTSGR